MLVRGGQTNREIASVIGTAEQVIKNYLRNALISWVFGAAWIWHST
jgi:DNA-binding CsgD family transcriptional regulator